MNTKICFKYMNIENKIIKIFWKKTHQKVRLKYLFRIIKRKTSYNFNNELNLNYVYDENKRLIMNDTILNVFRKLKNKCENTLPKIYDIAFR